MTAAPNYEHADDHGRLRVELQSLRRRLRDERALRVEGGFRGAVTASIRGLVAAHRDAAGFFDGDRRLAMALLEVLDADSETLEQLLERLTEVNDERGPVERRNGVNRLISRAVKTASGFHESDEPLGDGQVGKPLFHVPGVDERPSDGVGVGGGDSDEAFELADGADDGVHMELSVFEHFVRKFAGYLQVFRDFVTRHSSSPSLGADTSSVGEGGCPGVVEDAPAPGHAADFAATVAAYRAVSEWFDADPGRGLNGCTPSMVAGVALAAYRKALTAHREAAS